MHARCCWVVLLVTACASAPPSPRFQLRKVDEALVSPDWPAVHLALEEAALLAPDDLEVNLRLAEMWLTAYGEVERARWTYWKLRKKAPARSRHGLGLCALWGGEERRALELFFASLAERETPECARDLAARLLARGEDASAVLDIVAEISGETLRSRLLLAAAGRRPRPAQLPEGWSFGLERARLAPLPEARKEVEAYLEAACASPAARAKMRAVLAGDFALRRNLSASREVKD